MITASMLYNLVQCPHRMYLDKYGDQGQKDRENPFIELLWERGTKYEEQVVSGLGPGIENFKISPPQEKTAKTLAAMQAGVPLIYGGRIETVDLVGEPDLLRHENDAYVAIDIKSGAGEEGDDDDRRPKTHYAVQLGLYTDILQQLGHSAGHYAFIFDIHGEEVRYDFDVPYGVRNARTLWEDYQDALTEARAIDARQTQTLPAYGSVCKLCHWYSACLDNMRQADDLSLIFELGRSKRDALMGDIGTLSELAACNPNEYIHGRQTDFPGIGPDSLRKFQRRAMLASEEGDPYLTQAVAFPDADQEIHFDIEVDPLRDFCYLHGFVERDRRANTSKYVPFFANRVEPALEKAIFADAWRFLQKRNGRPVYYYSKYERTWWRRLAERYPDICSIDAVNALFESPDVIDLYYDVVRSKSEWPTIDYSVKTLARHLGFNWRDTHPSGAASVEWFDQWVTTGDLAVRERILQYNEDDCRATGVLLDGLRVMPVHA